MLSKYLIKYKNLIKKYLLFNFIFIYRLSDVIQSEGRLYLVFEFVDKDLKKYFEACEGPLAPQLIKSYAYQLLAGMEYCHVRGVMHRYILFLYYIQILID